MEKENPEVSTANIGSSNTNLLSQEEMDALKKANLIAYVKMLLNNKGSYTDKFSSSSNVYGGTNGPETVDEILKQLKTLVGGINLFEVLEKDFIYGHSIKVLLKKLDVPDALVEVVDFLVIFGPLF